MRKSKVKKHGKPGRLWRARAGERKGTVPGKREKKIKEKREIVKGTRVRLGFH